MKPFPRESAADLWHALNEILNYEGGAENALSDEYVMERSREILDAHAEALSRE